MESKDIKNSKLYDYMHRSIIPSIKKPENTKKGVSETFDVRQSLKSTDFKSFADLMDCDFGP